MHINSMPDLVLRLIFSKLSLQDLYYVGRVCELWKWHQMEITKRVRSLTVLIGSSSAHSLITNSCFTLKYRDLLLNEDGTRMYPSQHLDKFFHITYEYFSSDCAVELTNIFPRITSLEIAIKFDRGPFLLSPIVPLLTKWSRMLKSLKMYVQCNPALFDISLAFAKDNNEFGDLFEVINSMLSLEHLTLDTDAKINPSSTNSMYSIEFLIESGRLPNLSKTVDLPILYSLREFYFKSDDDVKTIEKFLHSYAAPNEDLEQIGLNYSNVLSVYSRLRQLQSKMVYLPLHVSSFNRVRNIMKPFSAISKLDLASKFEIGHFDRLSINGLNSISTLPQLTHLHLSSYKEDFFPKIQTLGAPLAQLASVQVLTICTALPSISVFGASPWAHLFPNVQVIELTISETRVFSFNKPLRNHSKQDLQQILTPFAQCLKLHHIYTCEKYSNGIQGNKNCKYEMLKEWILLQENDRKIVTLVEKK